MRHKSGVPSVLPIAHTLERHIDAFRHHLSAALDETQDPVEPIHKTRVATRRLQADLDLLQFGRNAVVVRDIKQRLRTFRNGLSTLRNYDVLVGIVQSALGTADDTDLPDLELLARRLCEERTRVARRAGKILRRFKLKPVLSLLETPNRSERKHGLDLTGLDEAKIKRRAARRLTDRLATFLTLVSRLKDTSDPVGVHELRIAAKRLRYLVETLSDLGLREPKGALHWLRIEQGKIGDWHDLFCLEEEVLRLVGQKEALHGRLDESAALLRATSRLLKARDLKAARMFPVKPPNYFARSLGRLTGDLMR